MELLAEIWRHVLRYATEVPAALDTSFEAAADEDEWAISVAIRTSVQCKLALSLTSKMFHELTDEFLFQIIHISRPASMRLLLDQQILGQRASNGCTRGWWCRRLSIKLGVSRSSWASGNSDLWGLLTSCPRLIDLRCSIFVAMRREYHTSRFDYGRPVNMVVSRAFLKTVASLYGNTLQRLELSGQVRISGGDVERFLACMTRLEACRFSALTEWTGLTEGRVVSSAEEEDESEGSVHSESGMSWPVSAGTPVTMPHLHSLAMTPLLSDTAQWSLPSLRAVGTNQGILSVENISRFLKTGLENRALSIQSFAFANTGPDIGAILHLLPSLRRLVYPVTLYLHAALKSPHEHLDTIVLLRSQSFPHSTVFTLDDVLGLVRAQKLPALRTIRAWGDVKGGDSVHAREEEVLVHGIRLEISNTKRFVYW